MSSNSESTKSRTMGSLTPGSKEEKAALAELRHERLLFCLGSLLGTCVEVEVKGGSVFRGIFHGASKELGLCLKYCRLLEDRKKTSKDVIETLVVEPKDFVQLLATEVDFQNAEYQKACSSSSQTDWNTDAEIAARTGSATSGARELLPFEQVVSLPGDTSHGVTFGDLDASVVPEWDQFTLNKEKFGVNSTFKEELYTTKLDRSAPDFDEKLRKAEELAQQIRRAETSNIHLKEERGQELEKDYDEELLYGAVIRENDGVALSQESDDKEEPAVDSSMSVSRNEELNGNSNLDSLHVSDFRQRTTEEFRRFKEEMDKRVKSSSQSKNENHEKRNHESNPTQGDEFNFQLPKNVKDNEESSGLTSKSVATSRLNVHAAEFRPGEGFIYHLPNNRSDHSYASMQEEESGVTQEFGSLSTNDVAKSNINSGQVEPSAATVEESSNNARLSYPSVSYSYGSYPASAPYEGSPSFVPYNMTVGYNTKSGFVVPPNVTSPPLMGRNMGSSFGVPINNYPIPNIPQAMNMPYYYGPGQQFYYAAPYHGMLNPAHYVPNFPIPPAAVGSPVIGGFQPRSPQNDWISGNDSSPYVGPSPFPSSMRTTQRAAMGVPVPPQPSSEHSTGNNDDNKSSK